MFPARRAAKLRRTADQYERAAAAATRIGYDAGVVAFFPAGGSVMFLDRKASADLLGVLEEVKRTALTEGDLTGELQVGEPIWESFRSMEPETAAAFRRALRLAAQRKRDEAAALARLPTERCIERS